MRELEVEVGDLSESFFVFAFQDLIDLDGIVLMEVILVGEEHPDLVSDLLLEAFPNAVGDAGRKALLNRKVNPKVLLSVDDVELILEEGNLTVIAPTATPRIEHTPGVVFGANA